MRTQTEAAAEALALAEEDCRDGLALALVRSGAYPNRREARFAVLRGELLGRDRIRSPRRRERGRANAWA